MLMSTGERALRRFEDGAPGSQEPEPNGPPSKPGDPFTPNHPQAVGPLNGHRPGDDFHPAQPTEEKLL